MTVKVVRQPQGLCEPIGLYSNMSVGTGGPFIAVAGQVGIDNQGRLAGDGGMEAQVRQVFENIGLALAEAGASFRDVLKTTTYLVAGDDLPEFSAARTAVFAELFPNGDYPPNTLLIVSRLIDERFLVEIEALAIGPG